MQSQERQRLAQSEKLFSAAQKVIPGGEVTHIQKLFRQLLRPYSLA